MKFRCTVCAYETKDISPLGPEGIVICEDCARTKQSQVLLEDVRNATLAAIALGVDPEKRIAIAKAAQAERLAAHLARVTTLLENTCPASRIEQESIKGAQSALATYSASKTIKQE